MIKSVVLFVLLVAPGPRDQDWAEIVYNGVRFEAAGKIDWTRHPDHYWRFDWDINLPVNKRNYEKARAKQAKTPLPYGVT
jgi:hypothetical protein